MVVRAGTSFIIGLSAESSGIASISDYPCLHYIPCPTLSGQGFFDDQFPAVQRFVPAHMIGRDSEDDDDDDDE